MNEECFELQQCEMEALTAIYGDGDNNQFAFTVDSGTDQISGTVGIEVDTDSVARLLKDTEGQDIKYLPPIQLQFTLPPAYPLDEAPVITLFCCWLDDQGLGAIKERLSMMWELERGMGVIHSYIDLLTYDLSPSETICVDLHSDRETVLAHNQTGKRRKFEKGIYACAICMEDDQPGKHCMELSCGHVFCRHCLAEYLGMIIAEGSLILLKCPDPECRKSPAQPSISDQEMADLLDVSQIARYTRLSEQRRVDQDTTRFAWCPRSGCGLSVECDARYPHLSQCACGYTFCNLCLRAWHGTNYCEIKSSERILRQYIRVVRETVDSQARARLERQYGQGVLQKMLRDHDQDNASVDFIRESSQQCPKCKLFIQKAFGCNHMQCTRCAAHFCYLCGVLLHHDNPMKHFNNTRSACNRRLFEGLETGDQDQEGGDDEEANLLIRLAFGGNSSDEDE
ncbi:RWD domain-containing protein [Kickxella alabastrina]|uniref:RWD domain-containing protein n=1 Tax=Kickxella alabastrina TaxID=61397 RepID=UPI00221ECCA0|nr:RWD domain-containing protein [Kickxella alabastrina]KAI7821806.1 RWD domain-containing protein [Kickxella alabastrina]